MRRLAIAAHKKFFRPCRKGGGIGVIIIERHRRFELAAGDICCEARSIRHRRLEALAEYEDLAQLLSHRVPKLDEIGIALRIDTAFGVEIHDEDQEWALQVILRLGDHQIVAADTRPKRIARRASGIGHVVDDHEAREMVALVARKGALPAAAGECLRTRRHQTETLAQRMNRRRHGETVLNRSGADRDDSRQEIVSPIECRHRWFLGRTMCGFTRALWPPRADFERSVPDSGSRCRYRRWRSGHSPDSRGRCTPIRAVTYCLRKSAGDNEACFAASSRMARRTRNADLTSRCAAPGTEL